MWKLPGRLESCHNIDDLRLLARCRLPIPIFNFLDGAAETEFTSRRNITAFDDLVLLPRVLVDVSSLKTKVSVLGQELDWPVFCSPTGSSRLFHPDGEMAVARASRIAGTLYGLSFMSSHSLEEVAVASDGPKMFQIMMLRDRGFMSQLIERCRVAGYQALCLTVDCVTPGKRERDLRSGLGMPPQFSFSSLASFASHPKWVLGQLAKGSMTMPNVRDQTIENSMAAHSRYFGEQLDPSATWSDVKELIKIWNGPFAVKGVMTVDDAKRALDIGATAVIVSNHGGRQLDGAAVPLDVLAEISHTVGDQLDVILDGGVRRGTHVLKAIALGAKACSIGRPYLYGLAAGGEAGVNRALELLKSEFLRSMALSGCRDLKDINQNIVKKI